LIQLLSFTLISCFWNEYEKSSLNISEKQWKVFKGFFLSNELNNQAIKYPSLLVTIREIFEVNQLDPFITEYQELKKIFDNEESFYEVHLHMQGIKSSILNKEIDRMDVNWLCYETENLLCQILSRSGFIVKYKLTTIKSIELAKSRLKKPSYYIKRIILDRFTVSEDDTKLYTEYTDSRSVILAKNIDPKTPIKFLSLSPFIIDENALKGEDLSKLFFFSHSDGDCYVYRLADNPDETLRIRSGNTYSTIYDKDDDELELINLRMTEIKNELDTFKSLIEQ